MLELFTVFDKIKNMYTYLLWGLVAYLIGSISPSYLISTIKKKNIRANGSSNLGASNTAVLLGAKWGVLVGFLDIMKGCLPVLFCVLLGPENEVLPYVVGACCILGHIFPFYLKFKGGKGLATYMGLLLGIDWRAFIVIGALLLLAAIISDYIVMGTFACIIGSPIYTYIVTGHIICTLVLVAVSLIMVVKHIPNVRRIINKEETKIREGLSGKHKL